MAYDHDKSPNVKPSATVEGLETRDATPGATLGHVTANAARAEVKTKNTQNVAPKDLDA